MSGLGLRGTKRYIPVPDRLQTAGPQQEKGQEIRKDITVFQQVAIIDPYVHRIVAENIRPKAKPAVVVKVKVMCGEMVGQGGRGMTPKLSLDLTVRLGAFLMVRDGVAVLAAQIADDADLVELRAQRLGQGGDGGFMEEEREILGTGHDGVGICRGQADPQAVGVQHHEAFGQKLAGCNRPQIAVQMGSGERAHIAAADGPEQDAVVMETLLQGGGAGLVSPDMKVQASHPSPISQMDVACLPLPGPGGA